MDSSREAEENPSPHLQLAPSQSGVAFKLQRDWHSLSTLAHTAPVPDGVCNKALGARVPFFLLLSLCLRQHTQGRNPHGFSNQSKRPGRPQRHKLTATTGSRSGVLWNKRHFLCKGPGAIFKSHGDSGSTTRVAGGSGNLRRGWEGRQVRLLSSVVKTARPRNRWCAPGTQRGVGGH